MIVFVERFGYGCSIHNRFVGFRQTKKIRRIHVDPVHKWIQIVLRSVQGSLGAAKSYSFTRVGLLYDHFKSYCPG